MKSLLIITALALGTGCASTPQLRAKAESVATRAPASDVALVADPAADDLNAVQQVSVEIADHLVDAQPGELGLSLEDPAAPERKRVATPRAAARPKLVSKHTRARLFVLSTRSPD